MHSPPHRQIVRMMRGWTFNSPTLSSKKCVNKCKFDEKQPLDTRIEMDIFHDSELEKGRLYRQLEDEG